MALPDDAICVEHDWQWTGLALSLADGAGVEETCQTCGQTRVTGDRLRNDPRRPRLAPLPRPRR